MKKANNISSLRMPVAPGSQHAYKRIRQESSTRLNESAKMLALVNFNKAAQQPTHIIPPSILPEAALNQLAARNQHRLYAASRTTEYRAKLDHLRVNGSTTCEQTRSTMSFGWHFQDQIPDNN
eukprot:scaffold505283_cov39-Prasinocladus_malaysianus.AAC.1